MTDKELLELAAKAAGIACDVKGPFTSVARYDLYNGRYTEYLPWNPLTDDGEALRLMARLNINISYRENINGAWVVAEHENIEFCPESLDGPPEDVATRRAIVRAAAEIGKESHDPRTCDAVVRGSYSRCPIRSGGRTG